MNAVAQQLEGLEHQAHARVALEAALAAKPTHAYLFEGPEGVGKAAAARAFAAELLAANAPEPEGVRKRVQSGVHPDLTWIEPRGAHGILVDDVRQDVVAAASLRPFESERRVFVIDAADQMNIASANTLLKTLEEPPPYVHLILVSSHQERLPATIVSRCQAVRFDPLPESVVEATLTGEGVDTGTAQAVARLAGGNLRLARFLASEAGAEFRESAEATVRAALGDKLGDRPWLAILKLADESGKRAEATVVAEMEAALESLPKGRERNAAKKEYEQAATRSARRESTLLLDLALKLMQAWLRDLLAIAGGACETALNRDRLDRLRSDSERAGRALDASNLAEALRLCEETRQSLRRNVTAELAFESLCYRLSSACSIR